MRTLCGEQFIDWKGVKDLMLLLSLNETMAYLPMANSLHWYGHVLKRLDGYMLKGIIV